MRKDASPATERILDIWVQPRACRNEVLISHDKYLRVRVIAAPTAGRANQLCRKILAEALGVPVSRVEILSGHKARRKRVRIIGGDSGRWERLEKNREEER